MPLRWSISRIAPSGTTPGKPSSTSPPLSRNTVGIERTWKAAAICGSASTSTFASTKPPPYSAASFSSTGASCLHGPHHPAQKSTSTGTCNERCRTSASKASVVMSMMCGDGVCSGVIGLSAFGLDSTWRRARRMQPAPAERGGPAARWGRLSGPLSLCACRVQPSSRLHPERSARLRAARTGGRRAALLGRDPRLRGGRGLRQAQVLLPVDAAVPVRCAAHGPRAQLHHWRRDQPLQAHDRVQRAAADGLGRLRPARRERGDQEPHRAGEMDPRQHRPHARAAAADGLRDRLVARVRHLRPGLLRPRAAHVRAADEEGAGLPQELGRQLGPGGPDRAGQRAGDRRAWLAHGRAGGKARDPAVVPEDHRLRPGTAGRARPARRLARRGQDHAAQLDRPFRGPGDPLRRARRRRERRRPGHRLHHPPGHPDGGDLPLRRGRAPAGGRGRADGQGGGRLRRGTAQGRRERSRAGDPGKARHVHRPPCAAPDHRRGTAGVRRELRADGLRHRCGHGRARARRARLGVRPRARAADEARRRLAGGARRAGGDAPRRGGQRQPDDGRAGQIAGAGCLRHPRRGAGGGGLHRLDPGAGRVHRARHAVQLRRVRRA